jgi:hypothetical protein
MARGGRRWPWGLLLVVSGLVLLGLLLHAQDEHLLGSPAHAGVGGPHAFLQHQPGDPDDPVAWDPCQEIHYEVNPAGGPDDAAGFVAEAITEVQQITGLQFHYDGSTDRRPDESGEASALNRAPVLIAWADEDEVPSLAGDVVGVGGAAALRFGRWWRYTTGGVTLDTDLGDDLDSGEAHAVLLHELGHLVGLDHVSDPSQLMFSETTFQDDYGPGDREGLIALGKGRCG